jgi:hypothetical protein
MSKRNADGFVPPRLPLDHALLDVNQQDYPTQLNKAMQLQVRPPGRIDPRVSVGVQLDDYTMPEFWWLRRGIRGYAGDARAANAGQFNFFAIQCLPGSLLVIEKLIVGCQITSFVKIGLQTAQPAAAAATAGTPLDARAFGQGGAARWVLSSNAAVTGPTIPTSILCAANALVTVEPGAVLTGGNWFSVISTAVNIDLAVTVIYRERRLLPSEE